MKKLTAVLSIIFLLTLATPVYASAPVAKAHYIALLRPLNNSGVRGIAQIWVDGQDVKVMIHANNLTPDEVHFQHIHMGGSCDEITPVLYPLTPYPTSSQAGVVDYKQVFENALGTVNPLETRTIILHGMFVNGEYNAGIPVACGEVIAVPGFH